MPATQDGHEWCIEVKRMDNPALSSVHQEDFSEFIGEVAGGISSGERIPLLVYRVYVADGHEELVRGGSIEGLIAALAAQLFSRSATMPRLHLHAESRETDSPEQRSAHSAPRKAAFPARSSRPSLLLDDVEIRGFHGEPRRLPLVAPPPLK